MCLALHAQVYAEAGAVFKALDERLRSAASGGRGQNTPRIS